MPIEPDQFDVPVKDYVFTDASSPRSLLDQMATAGGFTATKLAMARDILRGMDEELRSEAYDAHAGWQSRVCFPCDDGGRGIPGVVASKG